MRKYKIVIVENDEDEQFFIKLGFEDSGLFEILALVKNGDTLFEWLQQHPLTLPEIILSDLNMPGKNGYDIIAEIKASPIYSNIPVIITSTSSIKSTMDRCFSIGAAEYLIKPDVFTAYAPFAIAFHALIEDKQLVL